MIPPGDGGTPPPPPPTHLTWPDLAALVALLLFVIALVVIFRVT